jgi:hypothetical protein
MMLRFISLAQPRVFGQGNAHRRNAGVSQRTSVLRALPRPKRLIAICRSNLQIRSDTIQYGVFRSDLPLSDKALESSGKVSRVNQRGTAMTIGRAPSMRKTHCHDFKPPFPFSCNTRQCSRFTVVASTLTLSMAMARNPETACAKALEL